MASFNQPPELTPATLKSNNFDVKKLISLGCTIKQLRAVFFDADQFKEAGTR